MTAGAATVLGLPVLETGQRCAAGESGNVAASGFPTLPVRPYQLMCVICRIGAGCTGDLGDPRLTEIINEIELRAKVELAKLTRDV